LRGSRFGRPFLSLRVSLAGAFVGIVLLTSLLLGAALYFDMHRFIRNDLRAQLRAAVGVGALEIDTRVHDRLKKRADESGAAYARIKKQLQSIRSRSKGVRFVYTYRKDDQGRIQFVVDAEEKAEAMSHIGDVYPSPTPAMLKVLTPPYEAHVDKEFVTDQWGSFISGFAPLVGPDGKAHGALGMDFSAQDAAVFERHVLLLAGAILGCVTLVVALLSLILTQRIAQPLKALAVDMERIQHFELDSDADVQSRIEEVVLMKTSLDNMKKGLRSFKRYVPADLVSDLIQLGHEAELGAEKRTLTVLFSDIEGFTSISEKIPPEELSARLGVYFEGMTRAILDQEGTVDKFVGDAIMAFWGAPHRIEDHAARACRAALACQAVLKEKKTGFHTRFGLNTGEVLVGNFGYRERLSYTVLGDSVNLSSRLEGLNKHYGTQILVAQSTLEAAGRDGFLARPIDLVAVKGKHQGVRVFELAAEARHAIEEDKTFFRKFEAAMAHYEGRRWSDAADAFDDLSRERPHDKPSKILRDRCRTFAATAPSADWDGVTVLHEK
jgi:class 3 adenylate cyclase